MTEFKDTEEYKRGRLGEILQLGWYRRLGVEMEDLSDRTDRRAPLLYGREGTIRSPDVNAIKTARFFLEFKTKTIHEPWKGGGKNDLVRYSAREEQGIDTSSRVDYCAAQKRWRQPVVLSILVIKPAILLAATLDQLGEPRHSPHPAWPIDNWGVKQFSQIATFDPDRLDQFFNKKETRAVEGRARWLNAMPHSKEIDRVLNWLGARQGEFGIVRQFIFDQIEREWQ